MDAENAAKVEVPVPTIVGPIYGWRSWRVRERYETERRPPELWSPYWPVEWRPGEVVTNECACPPSPLRPALRSHSRPRFQTCEAHTEIPLHSDAGDGTPGCGLYAYRFRSGIMSLGLEAEAEIVEGRFVSRHPMVCVVHPIGWAYGLVALWGRVAKHTMGYRAEYAQIIGIVAQDAHTRHLVDGWSCRIVPVGAHTLGMLERLNNPEITHFVRHHETWEGGEEYGQNWGTGRDHRGSTGESPVGGA